MTGRPRVSIDVVAGGVIVLLSVTAPAFGVDDAAFFNYLHNVIDPSPLYYYMGYVHFMPELITYLLRPLPLLPQVLLYRVVPLVLALLLYRESAKLLALRLPGRDAKILALGLVLVLRAVEVNLWANLSHSMWTALLVATAAVLRCNVEGRAYSWRAWLAVLIASVTFPVGLTLVLLFVAFAATTSNRRLKAQNAALALATVSVQAWSLGGSPDPAVNTNLMAIPRMFADGFRDRKLHNLIALGSLAVLPALLWWTRRRPRESRAADRAVMASLCWLAWSSSVLYVASSRFARYDGGFESRFAVLPAFCALIAVGWTILSDGESLRRSLRVGIHAGASIAVVAASLYGSLRGPLELALMKYRFVAVAAAARSACRPDEVYVFEDDETSPALFCTPRALPRGDFQISGFSPSVGSGDPEATPEARPFVMNPKPFP